MGLGAKLKQLREEKGWTQVELAAVSGVDRGYISQLETDRIKSPSADTFLKLATALHIDEDELLVAAGLKKGTGEPTMPKTPEEEMTDLLEVIYRSGSLSREDKQFFAMMVNRTFENIRLRREMQYKEVIIDGSKKDPRVNTGQTPVS